MLFRLNYYLFILVNYTIFFMNFRKNMQNFEIRVLLKFFWKKGLSARAAAREICSVEGEGSVSNPTASAWFKNSIPATQASKINRGLVDLQRWILKSCVNPSKQIQQPAPGDCQANLGLQNPPSLANSTSLERSTSAAEKCPTN